MNGEQLTRFRERLKAEQDRLEREAESSDESRREAARPTGEVGDLATHAADRDAEGLMRELTVERTLREELRQVLAALERTRDGSYGRCVRCGSAIPVERLEALPATPHCIGCARSAERA